MIAGFLSTLSIHVQNSIAEHILILTRLPCQIWFALKFIMFKLQRSDADAFQGSSVLSIWYVSAS